MSSATGPHPHPPPTDRRREWERAKERKDQLIIQPDGQIRSPSTSLLIEAKRIRVGGFQPEQLAGCRSCQVVERAYDIGSGPRS